MTDTTKSFLKHTILGLIGGGTASALYAMNNSRASDSKPDQEFGKDEIVVPLSRSNFLKAVRPEALRGGKARKEAPAEPPPAEEIKDIARAAAVQQALSEGDAAKMSPKELAALKKAILRKHASDKSCGHSSIKKVVTTSSATVPVKRIPGAGSTYPRDSKGRFVADSETTKSAGIGSFLRNVIPGVDSTLNDAGSVIMDNAGLVGGISAGLVAAKLVSDRILINKKKRQVEKARQMYADALAREVNDEDLPYYRKTASDRGILGSALGYLGLAGLATSATAGIVMYRIMENRRKELEKAKDKDLARYPYEKSIRFRFPKPAEDADFFA